LASASEHAAPDMNAQAIANTLNALSKLKPAIEAMTAEGWGALSIAAKYKAPEMEPHHVSMTLNAFGKMEPAVGLYNLNPVEP
jgi:hypothetical protein